MRRARVAQRTWCDCRRGRGGRRRRSARAGGRLCGALGAWFVSGSPWRPLHATSRGASSRATGPRGGSASWRRTPVGSRAWCFSARKERSPSSGQRLPWSGSGAWGALSSSPGPAGFGAWRVPWPSPRRWSGRAASRGGARRAGRVLGGGRARDALGCDLRRRGAAARALEHRAGQHSRGCDGPAPAAGCVPVEGQRGLL